MKPSRWLGIALIVAGGLVLVYQGINYTRQKDVLDVGALHITAETQQRIPISPILGGLALAGGAVLLMMGSGANRSRT